MRFSSLFASMRLKPIVQNIIAIALYDVPTNKPEKINLKTFDAIFRNSLDIAAEGIISSENTKKKIHRAFQKSNLKRTMQRYRAEGQIFDEEYFLETLSKVISERNASKIFPKFIESFARQISNDAALSQELVLRYYEDIRKIKWILQGEALQELKGFIEEVKQNHLEEEVVETKPKPKRKSRAKAKPKPKASAKPAAAPAEPVDVPEEAKPETAPVEAIETPAPAAEPESTEAAAEAIANEIHETEAVEQLENTENEASESTETNLIGEDPQESELPANEMLEENITELSAPADEAAPTIAEEVAEMMSGETPGEESAAVSELEYPAPETPEVDIPEVTSEPQEAMELTEHLSDPASEAPEINEDPLEEDNLFAEKMSELISSGFDEDDEDDEFFLGALELDVADSFADELLGEKNEGKVEAPPAAETEPETPAEDELPLISEPELPEVNLKSASPADGDSETEELPVVGEEAFPLGDLNVDLKEDLEYDEIPLLPEDDVPSKDEEIAAMEDPAEEVPLSPDEPEAAEADTPPVREMETEPVEGNEEISMFEAAFADVKVEGEEEDLLAAEEGRLEEVPFLPDEEGAPEAEVDGDDELPLLDQSSEEDAEVETSEAAELKTELPASELLEQAEVVDEAPEIEIDLLTEAPEEVEPQPEEPIENTDEILPEENSHLHDAVNGKGNGTVKEEPVEFLDLKEEVDENDLQEIEDTLIEADTDTDSLIPEREEEIPEVLELVESVKESDIYGPVAAAPDDPRKQCSGEITRWSQADYVIPVRGLRKVESCLGEDPFLYIHGAPGAGKSVLISAYIYHQAQNELIQSENLFYFRFLRGITTYDAFIDSLNYFLESDLDEKEIEKLAAGFAKLIAETEQVFVLDDAHQIRDKRLLNLLVHIWNMLRTNEGFTGKFIVISQKQPKHFALEANQFYEYNGLSVAESSALLRDHWMLKVPKPLARELAKNFAGNPQIMLLFKNWWDYENHTDTELERYVKDMPTVEPTKEGESRLRTFVLEQLYSTFERVDSHLNRLIEAVSLYMIPESEDFYRKAYEKIGASDFQMPFEKWVEDIGFIEYDSNVARYRLPDSLRRFYYQKLQSARLRRILHSIAGQVYRMRCSDSESVVDAIEGARHFLKAEREEDAVTVLEPAMGRSDLDEYQAKQILPVLNFVNIDLLDTAKAKVNVLHTRGKFYLQTGNFKLAEHDFLACEKFLPPDKIQASIYFSLGIIAYEKKKMDDSLRLLQLGLELFEKLNDKEGIAGVYSLMGDIYLDRDQYKFAFDVLNKALVNYEALKDTDNTLHSCNRMGWICKERKDWDLAYGFYHKSLGLCEELNNRKGIAEALSNLGEIYDAQGDWEKAVMAYEKAIRINTEIQEWIPAASGYEQMGMIYTRRGVWDLAMAKYRRAQKISEKHEDKSGMASVYGNIGTVYLHRRKFDLAMEYYQKSQEIYEQSEEMDNCGQSYAWIATVYREMEEWERALDMYDKALEIKEKQGDNAGVAAMYEKIGDIYRDQEKYEYALEVFERAMSMKERLNDFLGVADIQFKIGQLFADAENAEKASELYQSALDIYEKIRNIPGMAKTYFTLGKLRHTQRNWEISGELYNKALLCYQEMDDPQGLAMVHYYLGNIHHDSGDWRTALEKYKQSMPLFEKAGDLFNVAQVMGNVSSIEFEQKNHTYAISKQIEILLYFQENGRKELVERVLSNLVACHEELGPDTFQALLTSCLKQVTNTGVQWGDHKIIEPAKAEEMVTEIFYETE